MQPSRSNPGRLARTVALAVAVIPLLLAAGVSGRGVARALVDVGSSAGSAVSTAQVGPSTDQVVEDAHATKAKKRRVRRQAADVLPLAAVLAAVVAAIEVTRTQRERLTDAAASPPVELRWSRAPSRGPPHRELALT